MRKVFYGVNILAYFALLAGVSTTAVAEVRAPVVHTVVTANAVQPPHIAAFEVSVSKTKSGKVGEHAPVELQNIEIMALEKVKAVSQSTTELTHLCEVKGQKTSPGIPDLTTCTTRFGYWLDVSDTQIDVQTKQASAMVGLNIVDLIAIKDRATAAGSFKEPILKSFKVEQLVQLAPGESVEGVAEGYAYRITLRSVK